jgi:molybdate transport system ATP-binding protein
MAGPSRAALAIAGAMIDADLSVSRGPFTLELRFRTPPEQRVTALFGASGSGKSTALALLAGALRPNRGRLTLGSDTLDDVPRGLHVPVERRRSGWVFQDGQLFPHLSVAANLDFGARRASAGAHERIDRDQVLDVLDLRALLGRRPLQLSGGERQRVAIGRALLSAPRWLLLDEPLASLDEPRKAEILALLERVKRDFDIPMVYVTHSLPEVLRLADRLVLLERGAVRAEGSISELVGRADTPLLAARADAGTLLIATLKPHSADANESALDLGDGQQLVVPRVDAAGGAAVRAYVRAAEVLLATERPRSISVRNVLSARVERIVAEADASRAVGVELRIGSHRLLARVTHAAARELQLAPDMPLFALIKSVGIEAPAGRDRF